ncbi:MAG TPA: hypothetical protein VGL38_10805 [bacterium]
MKSRSLPLSSLDADDAAGHLANLLGSLAPVPQTVLLIADNYHPLLRKLKRRLPNVAWRTLSEPVAPAEPFRLPLADRETDAVVVVDVIASLPRERRPGLVREALRIARRDALIAAPLGTDLQRLIEESLTRFHRQLLGTDHPWLAAHLAFGLPTPDEAFSWVRHGEDADMFYAGDVIAYQRMAEHVIRSAPSGHIATLLAQVSKHLLFITGRTELDLETVPMRRHRRLYLHLRRA